MAKLINLQLTRNADMKRGWHADKWVVHVPSSLATPPTVTEATIESNSTGMKICYNNTRRDE